MRDFQVGDRVVYRTRFIGTDKEYSGTIIRIGGGQATIDFDGVARRPYSFNTDALVHEDPLRHVPQDVIDFLKEGL